MNDNGEKIELREFKIRLLNDTKDNLVTVKAKAVRIDNGCLHFYIGQSIVCAYATGCWEAVFDVALVKTWAGAKTE